MERVRYYIFLILLQIMQLSLVIGVSVAFNKLYEMLIILFAFFICRTRIKKQFHFNSITKCTLCSMAVFGIVNLLTLNVSVSILSGVSLSLVVITIFYYIQEYIDINCELKILNNKLLNDKNILLKDLTLLEMKKRFQVFDNNEIGMIFDYFNKNNLTKNEDVAYNHGYSTRQLYRILKKFEDYYMQ